MALSTETKVIKGERPRGGSREPVFFLTNFGELSGCMSWIKLKLKKLNNQTSLILSSACQLGAEKPGEETGTAVSLTRSLCL